MAGAECAEKEASRTEGPGARLTFYVLLQLSKVVWADEALLFGHHSFLPKERSKESPVVQLLGLLCQRVNLGENQRSALTEEDCASFFPVPVSNSPDDEACSLSFFL